MKRKTKNYLVRACAVVNHCVRRLGRYTDDVLVSYLALKNGDLLLAAGVIEEFLERNKGREVSILCESGTAAMAKELGIFKNVYAYEGKKTFETLMKVRAKLFIGLPPDFPTVYRHEYCAEAVTADEKVFSRNGYYSYSEKEREFFNKKYRMITCDRTKQHYTDRCADFFTVLCGEEYTPRMIDLRPLVRERTEKEPYYVINLGSSQTEKRWPEERFAEVAEYIRQETGLKPVLVGAKKEKAYAEKFAACYTGPMENACGKTDLKELISLIGNAEFYFGNDTGTTHIAAACNVPNYNIATMMYSPLCLPYPKAMITEKVAEPVIFTADEAIACSGCAITKCRQTKECKQCVKEHGAFKCVHDLATDDVIEALRKGKYLGEYQKTWQESKRKDNKIIQKTEIKKLREEYAGRKIVFTNGCFDILHIGHVRCLQAAAGMGDLLVVGLNSDSSVKALKGETRPVNREEERAEFLAAFDFIDRICIFEEETPVQLLEALRPDIWVKGGDYNAENLPGHEIIAQWGGEIRFVPLTEGKSTTGMLEKLAGEESD